RGEYFWKPVAASGSGPNWLAVSVIDGSATTSGNVYVPPQVENFGPDDDGNLRRGQTVENDFFSLTRNGPDRILCRCHASCDWNFPVQDRRRFLSKLAEAWAKTAWQVHASNGSPFRFPLGKLPTGFALIF